MAGIVALVLALACFWVGQKSATLMGPALLAGFAVAVLALGWGLLLVRRFRRGGPMTLTTPRLVFASACFFATFSGCTAINSLSADPHRDVFGLTKVGYRDSSSGYLSPKAQRRDRMMKNLGAYLGSAHGWVSMALALLMSLPFLMEFFKLNHTPDWCIALCVALTLMGIGMFAAS